MSEVLKRVQDGDYDLIKSSVTESELKKIKKATQALLLIPGSWLAAALTAIPSAVAIAMLLEFPKYYDFARLTADFEKLFWALCIYAMAGAPFFFVYLALRLKRTKVANEAYLQEHLLDRVAKMRLEQKVAQDLAYEVERQRQLKK